MNAQLDGARDPLGSPIDWTTLFADDAPAEDWIFEPLIARGRGVSIYSGPKVGKSLLMLELAAAVATGGTFLGAAVKRRRVVYVDMENDPRGDVRTRLSALGYTSPGDLSWLVYYSFPTLSSLDTPAGGQQLHDAAVFHGADLVIIDTVSRTVRGEEDSNDTWLNFYRHTGIHLKRSGIGYVRLDHSGKDSTKGQRGGSAKGGDVDAVWRLSKVSGDTLRLECEMSRQMIGTRELTLHRRSYPVLRHELSDAGAAVDAAELEIVDHLDRLEVPVSAGRDVCRAALREAGVKVSTTALSGAVRRRKDQAETCPGQVEPRPLSWVGEDR